ncbi:VOC family protein [Buchananella hordeovulneris]|uniref:bleomycin resistance protein n=1 Tax=Buchananella hordeovulneris TaxID=52770 RepID=UPI000F5E99A5|nr:VOC family protein [Buchananella hordeovulneris]RRD53329.1 VOC family protein [Buchananella hordeovulneris]
MHDAPALVPELTVTDFGASLRFWCDLLGFEVLYDRPEERFAYLVLGNAHVMLDQVDIARTWQPAPLAPPLGCGINFELSVPDVSLQLRRLRAANWPLFMEPEEKWYRVGPTQELGVRQFLVQDPDGYLVRPQMSLGHRTLKH